MNSDGVRGGTYSNLNRDYFVDRGCGQVVVLGSSFALSFGFEMYCRKCDVHVRYIVGLLDPVVLHLERRELLLLLTSFISESLSSARVLTRGQ